MTMPTRPLTVIQAHDSATVPLVDEAGVPLPGIRGHAGATGTSLHGEPLGVDTIEMAPGSAFPLHVHPGDHILYVVSGHGVVHAGGTDYPVAAGDTVFVPAELPHGVRTSPGTTGTLVFIAVGHPHRPLHAADRMRRVSES